MSKTKIVQLLGGLNIPQSDWSQTDETAVDYIKNKPDIDGIVDDLNVRIDETKESINTITPESIGAATSDHSHDDIYYTEKEVDVALAQKSQVQIIDSNTSEMLPTLKIYRMTQEEYEQEIENGTVEENALYLTPEEEIDLSKYATIEQLSNKADINHNHDDNYYTKAEIDAVLEDVSSEKADASHNHNDIYYTEEEVDTKIDEVSSTVIDLSGTVTTNRNESIIGLSVSGTTVTYIKGDGSVHTFETQDTDTTYSLGTDEVTGLTKLYATTGNAEDGTMTQKAIKTELDKKVGVTVDDSKNTLIFTI